MDFFFSWRNEEFAVFFSNDRERLGPPAKQIPVPSQRIRGSRRAPGILTLLQRLKFLNNQNERIERWINTYIDVGPDISLFLSFWYMRQDSLTC